MKRLITFLLFIGLFAMATNVQANESWFKTLTKSETSFVIGGGFEVKGHRAYQFQAKVFNHYVGYSGVNLLSYGKYWLNNVVYYGYGINLGNIYELIHNSDNFGYKVFNRINFVPLYVYGWDVNYANNMLDEHRFSYIIDVNIIKFYNLGLNLQLMDWNPAQNSSAKFKLLFLNFNLRF